MKKILLSIVATISACNFLYAADKPSFPGGEEAMKKYISEKTVYPPTAKEMGVEGVVTIGFLVLTDGSIVDAKVVKFVDPDLEKEALKVVLGMPKWIPAEKDGNPIESPSSVNIPFILEQ